MSWGNVAVAAGTVVAGYMGSQSKKKAASTAAGAQVEAARLGIEETRRQFDKLQELLSPYVQFGEKGIGAYEALLGLSGPEAQRREVKMLEESPVFQSMLKQGESAILSNASATGGLRGGNTQGALAQYRPELLAKMVEQRYGQLSDVLRFGQASAAGVGAGAQQAGANIASLMQQTGAAQAGSAIAAGKADAENWNTFAETLGFLNEAGVF